MTQQPAAPTAKELAFEDIEAANRDSGDNPIKIGILTPFTPPGDATAGVLYARGARLGAEYLREHGGVLGGRGVKLIPYNDMETAREDGFNGSAVKQLAMAVMIDEVHAMIGQWHLRTSKWVVPMADKLGVPMFVENGDSDATRRRRAIFRTYHSIADRVPYMGDCLASFGAKRIGAIAPDTVFGQTVADTLQKYCEEKHGMEFLRIDFPQEETTDWHDSLRKIAAWKPDVFVNGGLNVIAGGGPVGNSYVILQQAIEVGLLPGIPMMVTFGFPMRSADYWRMAGEAGVGVMWAALEFRPSWDGMTEIGRWFSDRFMERYGFAAPDTVLSAFTDVTIIGQALNAAGSDTHDALIDALESEEFDTWRGPMRFERGEEFWHHNTPQVVIMQYQKFNQSFDEAAVIWPENLADAKFASPAQLD